jgi:RNAse (barnase) inhibitor barstar
MMVTSASANEFVKLYLIENVLNAVPALNSIPQKIKEMNIIDGDQATDLQRIISKIIQAANDNDLDNLINALENYRSTFLDIVYENQCQSKAIMDQKAFKVSLVYTNILTKLHRKSLVLPRIVTRNPDYMNNILD